MKKILSICIPTYGRVQILQNTLNSIFEEDVSPGLFEVCISDNSPTDETKEMLEQNFSDKTNIIYNKSTCEGYLNSIEALKLGTGEFLKLHNNYSKFCNTLQLFIDSIQNNIGNSNVLFYTFGALEVPSSIIEYQTFNDFMNGVTILSTWSTSFGLWKADFDTIISRNVELDKMFPHTSLLFELVDKNKYIVDNYKYFENQDVGKKGGYNLPETFGNRFIKMINSLLEKKYISTNTYEKIKLSIFDFICEWYFNVHFYSKKYYFDFTGWEAIIMELFDKSYVRKIKSYCLYKSIKQWIKKLLFIEKKKI